MTPEQSFSRWVKVALTAFFVLFGYFLIVDNYLPMTTEARLQRYVTPVSARVSGQVNQVYVVNNQEVTPGQALFSLDDSDFALAVARSELALAQAQSEQIKSQSGLAELKAELHQSELQATEQARETTRIARLFKLGHISKQQLDQANTKESLAREASAVSRARLQEVTQALTGAGIMVQQAEEALNQVKLDLTRTQVLAETAGRIGNLQLRQGQHANAGQPLLALISDQSWVSADLREKSLRHVTVGTTVDVVFDALPGEVFKGHVTTIDSGVREGQEAADGLLVQPMSSDRWVRDAQRLRTNIELDENFPELATGAKATVQLYPINNPILDAIAVMQIHVVSVLRYLY